MGCFIYCLMGTSKDITMGPTAIMSILVSEYAKDPNTIDNEEKVSSLHFNKITKNYFYHLHFSVFM